MCDEWMPTIKLTMGLAQFQQLPRNAAYRYEYLDGTAYLSPRPRHYHAVFDLTGPGASESLPVCTQFSLRQVQDDDWPKLVELFMDAFAAIQPFGSLDEFQLREASFQCVERTRLGNDGPVITSASCVAVQEGRLVGAALITLVPPGDPCETSSYRWQETPPEDSIAQRLGRPHLTWIFVAPMLAGHGVGTALLANVVTVLRQLDFTQLLTTFIAGNDSSILWHWRNGFQLLSYPISRRLMLQRRQQRREE